MYGMPKTSYGCFYLIMARQLLFLMVSISDVIACVIVRVSRAGRECLHACRAIFSKRVRVSAWSAGNANGSWGGGLRCIYRRINVGVVAEGPEGGRGMLVRASPRAALPV